MPRKTVEKNIAYDDIKKLYYVTFNFGVDENGKQIKKTQTFSKLSDARKALREHEANKTKGLLVKPKKITLGEWLDYWMNNVIIPNREATTVYGYNNIISKHIKPAIGKTEIQNLKPKDIQQYFTHLLNEKGLKNNTIRKHRDLLKTALELAVKQDIILNNPMSKVEPPKTNKAEIGFYNADQLIELIELAKGSNVEIIIVLGAYLGLRRGEICGLKWLDIDFENKVINIQKTRTAAGSKIVEKGTKNESSHRKVYVSEYVVEALLKTKANQEEYRKLLGCKYKDSGYVVTNEYGHPRRPNYVSDLVTQFVEKNNLCKITLHGLRHSFASICNSSGLSLYDIGKALGHSSTSTTDKVYTHVFDDTHKNTFEKVAEKLK